MASVSCKSHTVQFTHFNSVIFSIFTHCMAITVVNFRTLLSAQRKPYTPSRLPPTPCLAPGFWHYSCTLCLQQCLFYTFHRSGLVHYVAFCAWLLSLHVMFPRLTRLVACVSPSFLFMAESYCIARTDHRLPAEGHLACFQSLVSVALCVPVFVKTGVSLLLTIHLGV